MKVQEYFLVGRPMAATRDILPLLERERGRSEFPPPSEALSESEYL